MSEKKQVTVRLPSAALAMLDDLVGTIFGTSRADVARSLIIDQLKLLSEKQKVTWHVIKNDDD